MAEPVVQYAPEAPWWHAAARYSVRVEGDVYDVTVAPAEASDEGIQGCDVDTFEACAQAPDVEPFDALSPDFVAGHDAGYLSGVMDSAEVSAHAMRGARATAQRRYVAGHRQGIRDACALLVACVFAWWAGELLGAALAPFVAPKNSSGGAR